MRIHAVLESITFIQMQAILSMNESRPFGILPPMGKRDIDRDRGRRIAHVRRLAGLTQEEFARALSAHRGVKVSRGAIGNWERGHGVTRDNLIAVAEKYSVDFNWLATGRGIAPVDTTGNINSRDLPLAREGYRMPEVDARAGAGDLGAQLREIDAPSGTRVISGDAVSAEWTLPWSFVRSLGIHVEGVAWIVPIVGNSGYDPKNPGAPGSLFPGDRVIVDTSDRRPSPAGPFLLWDGLGIVVKLAELLRGAEPAKIRLISQNPRYKPSIVTADEARIIGRIRGRISAM